METLARNGLTPQLLRKHYIFRGISVAKGFGKHLFFQKKYYKLWLSVIFFTDKNNARREQIVKFDKSN